MVSLQANFEFSKNPSGSTGSVDKFAVYGGLANNRFDLDISKAKWPTNENLDGSKTSN